MTNLIVVCPRCGSDDVIELEKVNMWRCLDCGYTWTDKEWEKLKEKEEEEEQDKWDEWEDEEEEFDGGIGEDLFGENW